MVFEYCWFSDALAAISWGLLWYCFLVVVLGVFVVLVWLVRCLVFWLCCLLALLFVYFADCGLIAHYLVTVLC